jgi:RNA polymerase sigma-70 factor (ECF subfamily)
MARVPKVEASRPGAKFPERLSGSVPVETLDDRELVRRAQKGSQEAYEVLIQRHQHRVFAVARGIVKRQEDVEDISQQVFVKAYFSLKRFDQRAAFSTWLYKITVNECWDLLRKRKVRPLVYEADLSEEQTREYSATENLQSSGPDAAERLAAKEEISRLLSHLEERDRLMLIMKEVEGFSVEEIGDVLDLNANTVKVRLFRARRKIVGLTRKKD